MKVHFKGAITGNKNRYKYIIDLIEQQGHTVLTHYFASRSLEQISHKTPAESETFKKKSIEWLREADVIIFETTIPSIGTGYEIALAAQFKKPVIILYEPNEINTPHPVLYTYDDRIQVLSYNPEELNTIIKDSLDLASQFTEVRFTMILPGNIVAYLDEVAEHGTTRSGYIRELINKDMNK